LPQDCADAVSQSSCGSEPVKAGAQVPLGALVYFSAHASQGPSQAVSQHTSSRHDEDWQSSLTAQTSPGFFSSVLSLPALPDMLPPSLLDDMPPSPARPAPAAAELLPA